MTYEEIIARLDELKLATVRSAFERAVREEAYALLNINLPGKYTHRSAARRLAAATKDAEDFYATEVTDQLQERNETIQPGQVIYYRRKAIAWAVAQFIIAEEPEKVY